MCWRCRWRSGSLFHPRAVLAAAAALLATHSPRLSLLLALPLLVSLLSFLRPLLASASRQKMTSRAQEGEYLVKIRILEQENERFSRKIRGLEAQLSELEQCHGVRIQELLQVRNCVIVELLLHL